MSPEKQIANMVHLCRIEHDAQVEAGTAENPDFDSWWEFMGELALKLSEVSYER